MHIYVEIVKNVLKLPFLHINISAQILIAFLNLFSFEII